MTRLVLILAVILAVPASAQADAHEASLHLAATGGVATLGDPHGGEPAQIALVGGAARFTWASRDWLAWELEAYGAGTASGAHLGVDTPRGLRDFSRGAVAGGLEVGASLRLGVTVIPTLAVAVGPQLRFVPSTPELESGTGRAVGNLAAVTTFDVTARVSAGLDVRLGARWILGARASARQAVGIGDGSWRSFEATLHASYYWYPRWWTF